VTGPGRRTSAEVPYLLVTPPLTDPTYPYHSISYLVGKARSEGFTGYRCVDANIEALNLAARPPQVEGLLARAGHTRETAERGGRLSRAGEMRYYSALAGAGISPDAVTNAIAIFRDPALFYHYPTYRQAVMTIRRWMSLLSLDGAPGMFDGFDLRAHGPVNYSSYEDLTSPGVIEAVAGPFAAYFSGPFREILAERPWAVIGFSVNYTGQLPFALHMARIARAACPGAVIVFGGTEICDDVRFIGDAAMLWRLFRHADVLVAGEGESPLCGILRAVRDGTPLHGIKGAMARGESLHLGAINYENIGALPPPAYDIWRWEDYWAPEPVVLYSPTRGCYWNKCTFCDYGLNTDRPTSPARERPLETVMADLAAIAQRARILYFSVDAMSPRYVRTLAAAMAEAGLGLRWSAELRLERTFPKRGIGELLARGGCMAIAFGYESGSQRVLDLIDKGVRIDQVAGVLAELAGHGIAAQMMGFTGFPSETAHEATETYGYLARHRDLWSLAGIGLFVLTPGSIVAKQPERFGIDLLPLPATEDIGRFLPWRDRSTGREHWPADADDRVLGPARASILRGVNRRPFVGGIDSGHSLLYFARNGRALLPREAEGEPLMRLVGETWLTVPFANLAEFTTATDLETAYRARLRAGGVSHRMMRQWLDGPGMARRGTTAAVVLPSGDTVALPANVDVSPGSAFAQMLAILGRSRGAA
jgi:hypothetical protein